MDRAQVLQILRDAGFELAGIASAGPAPDFDRYQRWVDAGHAGEMRYLTDRRAGVRADLRQLLPTARTVLCVGKLYKTAYEPQAGARIARYAAGRDYHDSMREALERAVGQMQALQSFDYKICVDTAPLLERSVARQAGLGWIGRNTCLINEPQGSWFLLGEIVTSLELPPDSPPPDRCGSCTRCIEACPTQALIPDGHGEWTLDSRRCISYLTIELRGEIPAEHHAGIGDHLFGCDICQEVCPWNARAPETADPNFAAPAAFSLPLEQMTELTPEQFRAAFAETPVERTRWSGLQRNAAIVLGNRQ